MDSFDGMARCRRGGVPQGGTLRNYLFFCYLIPVIFYSWIIMRGRWTRVVGPELWIQAQWRLLESWVLKLLDSFDGMARCRRGGVPQGGTLRNYLFICYLIPGITFPFHFIFRIVSYVGPAHGCWCSSVENSGGLDNSRLNGRFGEVGPHGKNPQLFPSSSFQVSQIALSFFPFYQFTLFIDRSRRMGAWARV